MGLSSCDLLVGCRLDAVPTYDLFSPWGGRRPPTLALPSPHSVAPVPPVAAVDFSARLFFLFSHLLSCLWAVRLWMFL